MVPNLILALVATTTFSFSRGGMASAASQQEVVLAVSGADIPLSMLRKNDNLLAQSYIAAARRAHQNPNDLTAQLKAARCAFAVLQVADHSRQNDLARSIWQFGNVAAVLQRDSAEAHLWIAIGIAHIALSNNFLGNPRVRVKYEIAMRESIRLDPACLSGLAKLHLARMYTQPAAGFDAARASEAEALLREVGHQFPNNPLASVYLAERRFQDANNRAGLSLLAQLPRLRPSTPFEGLMKLATSLKSEAPDILIAGL